MNFGMIVFWLVVLMFAYQAARIIFELINRVVDAIIKAPGKGLKKVWNALKNRKLNKYQRKLEKEIWKQDKKARINAGLRNPSYQSAKAKKLSNKIEGINLKK